MDSQTMYCLPYLSFFAIGAKVYMLGRNKERIENAAKEVIDATGVQSDMIQVN